MHSDIWTLDELMHDYMDTVYDGEKLPREQVEGIKSAFISGADVILGLFQRLGQPDISDDELIEIVLGYEREIQDYIEERIREHAERN
tara:strand:- start:1173 stop:1436 length:264 start_codon:yes stop_codon:yes gene_type:complete